MRPYKRRQPKKQFTKYLQDTNTKIEALEKQIRETEDKEEIRKLKNKISSYQNRLSNKSNARDAEEKLKAKNTCIVALMDAMDNILNVKAKIEVVNTLDIDQKIQLQEAFKECEKQIDQQKKK